MSQQNTIESSVIHPGPRKYITFKEACAYIGKGRASLYKLCGVEIPYYEVGSTRLFTIADLDQWIESKRVEVYGRRRRR